MCGLVDCMVGTAMNLRHMLGLPEKEDSTPEAADQSNSTGIRHSAQNNYSGLTHLYRDTKN